MAAVVSGGTIIFGAPGAVYIASATALAYGIYVRQTDERTDNMLISAAVPGTNLAFALIFLLLLIFVHPVNSFLIVFASFGFSLHAQLPLILDPAFPKASHGC
jgi:hypothetical protein